MSTSCRRRSHKLTTDHQQKLDASNRQIEALKGAVIGLQKLVVELQAAQQGDGRRQKDVPAAKDAAPAQRMPHRQRMARSRAVRDHDTRYCSMTSLSGS